MSGIKVLHIIPEDNAPYIELCNHYMGYFKKLKFDYDKVLFSSNKKAKKTIKFKTKVTLKPGLNHVTLIVRTTKDFITSKDILIYNLNGLKGLNFTK